MPQTCINRRCNRLNPDDAAYCYFDGIPLAAVPALPTVYSGATAFPSPVLLPSGNWCHSFDDLLRDCQNHWAAALEALRSGQLADFFGQIGRGDLAYAARNAAAAADLDLALNELLGLMPSQALPPALLAQRTPLEVEFRIGVGEDGWFEVRLANQGGRLLTGAVQTDCPWLSLGGGAARQDFCRFKIQQEWTLPVHVRGAVLGACVNPYEGRLEITSNGGGSWVAVRVHVPPKPFGQGALAGALSPRDLVARVRQAPYDAVVWFENGAVLSWYRANNWEYPVPKGTRSASGLEAVRQFLRGLGLPDQLNGAPPRKRPRPPIPLHGAVGERVLHQLTVSRGRGDRPFSARAASDQDWLEIGPTLIDAETATVPLVVPAVPDRPGETLHAVVRLTVNDAYHTEVPVTLTVRPRHGEGPWY